jgi:hypothetical protein
MEQWHNHPLPAPKASALQVKRIKHSSTSSSTLREKKAMLAHGCSFCRFVVDNDVESKKLRYQILANAAAKIDAHLPFGSPCLNRSGARHSKAAWNSLDPSKQHRRPCYRVASITASSFRSGNVIARPVRTRKVTASYPATFLDPLPHCHSKDRATTVTRISGTIVLFLA